MTKSDAAILRKGIKRTPKVSDGTVVRYTKKLNSKEYNYVAIFIEATDSWYTTARYEESVLDNTEMMHELGKATKVAVANTWDEL